jgi:hypothetical protein
MKNILFLACAAALCLFSSLSLGCNEPNSLGSDIFNDESISTIFTDTLSINAETVKVDSIPGESRENYLCGAFEDPMTGSSEARLYAQFSRVDFPEFWGRSGVTLDSAFLFLEVNYAGVVGDTSPNVSFEIYRSTENFSDYKEIFTSRSVGVQPLPIGTITTSLKASLLPNDTVVINNQTQLVKVVKVPLTRAFLNTFIADSARIRADTANGVPVATAMRNWLKGLEIRPKGFNSTLASFKMGGSLSTTLRFYFTNLLESKKVEMRLGVISNCLTFNTFKQNYANGVAKDFYNSREKADSLLFLQGFNGLDMRFDFPTLKSLGKVIINKAELELTVVDNEQTKLNEFVPLSRVTAYNAQSIPIRDYPAGGTDAQVVSLFGGNLRSTFGVKTYNFVVTQQLQRMLSDREGSIIYLIADDKTANPFRTVFYGLKSSNSKFRPKLKVSYTKL